MESQIDHLQIHFDSQSLWMLNIALALVMFGIALDIRPSDFRQIWKAPRAMLTGVLCQFILLPLATFLLVVLIRPQPSFALGMILVASCPGGNVSNFMSHLARGNTALSVSLTAIATLAAVLMTPLNLQLWGGLYAPSAEILKTVSIDLLEMIRLVGLLLAVPLVCGMALRHYRPALALRLTRYFKGGSLLFFFGLIGLALWKDRDVFAAYVGAVFGIVLLHNLIALGTGFGTARLLRLSRKDVRTITLETGIQNSGLGLLLIFTFFDGLGGMALVAAFWGIWHLVSGLLVAGIWSRYLLRKEPVL